MITTSGILKQFRRRGGQRHAASAPLLIHPYRDWWIGLGLFAVIVLAGSVFLARMFFVHQTVDSLRGGEAAAIPRYHEAAVADVLTTYRERSARYDRFKATLPVIAEDESATSTATSTEEAVEADATLENESGSIVE